MLDLVAVHGFTQRGAAFEELERYLEVPVTAPDLPGHGDEPVRSWDEAVDRIGALLEVRPEPPVLAGYSMGGRLALATALRRPDLMCGLILISASPGIEDRQERRARLAADRDLADRIEAVGVEAFVDDWSARAMFAGLARRGRAWRQTDRQLRLSNTAAGLAGALRSLGQGAQPDYRPCLGGLGIPVLVIAGERDRRYCDLAAEMSRSIPGASTAIVRDAGHPVVGERPDAVAEGILAWAGW